ncbi:DUF371 domain-containing protein [Candidatus Bathyarchaeota archaeon]|nr:DUF371 domain-containing protein [Candidatus Bathyarchaeota archaeon]
MGPVLEQFTVSGHDLVSATHATTLEFTKDNYLTPSGNCIVGINASLAPAEFSKQTRDALREGKKFLVEIRGGNDLLETITGHGHPDLQLTHETDMVFRKSDFTCDRTVLVRCDKAARDLSAETIAWFRSPAKRIMVFLHPFE